ncbi:MAG: hypothetical protein NVSMB22_25500 [Chloroflexota bacterium]
MTYERVAQARYRCNMEWGRQAVRLAVQRRDVIVIVDTLRFSTATIVAVHRGAVIYPAVDDADAGKIAHRVHGIVAGQSKFSLSPDSYRHMKPGVAVVLPSRNGARCSRDAGDAPHLFVGALVNAHAVASVASKVLETEDLGITVVACGEYRSEDSEGGQLRFAIEDYLAAGAILSHLCFPQSPEAQLCAMTFLQAASSVRELLWDSVSGWELREQGLADDVRQCSRLDVYDTVPVMRNERFEKLRDPYY